MKALEINEKLKNGHSSIYILSGNDSYLRSYVVGQILKLIPAEDVSLCYDTLGDVGVDEIIYAAQTPSFLQSLRIVEVRDCNRQLTSSEKKQIEEYAQNPNEDSILIFNDCGATFSCINSFAIKVDCSNADDQDIMEFISKQCKANNFEIESGAKRELISLCSRDLGKINCELDKLFMYCFGLKAIKIEDVQEVTPADTEVKVFEMTNAMQKGEGAKALEVLDKLLERGEKPAYILLIIIATYRKLFQIAVSGADDELLCKSLGLSAYALGINRKIISVNKKVVSGYIISLKSTIDYLYELEYKFKSGAISPDNALNLAVIKLIAKRS